MSNKPNNQYEKSYDTTASSVSPAIETDQSTRKPRQSSRLFRLIGDRPVLTGLMLFGLTAAAVAYFPGQGSAANDARLPTETADVVRQPTTPQTNGKPRVDAVFVLDTTGSMGGLIQAAKDKIWSIASTLAAAEPTPEIRIGLVAYRDRGDTYVTRIVDLTTDLDQIHAALFELDAQGGGDGPEAVNQALFDAVHQISWNQSASTYRTLFLVGDAPPHMDYQDDVKYPVTLAAAKDKGIRVNAVQCGQSGETRERWQQIAQVGGGGFFQVEQTGGAVAIATPYDEKMAKLSAELDKTRIYYGSVAERQKAKDKIAAAEKVQAKTAAPALARRAAFLSDKAGNKAFVGENELVDEVASGRIELDHIDKENLPEPMREMTKAERHALIEENVERRDGLKRQIQQIAEERSAYLRKEVEQRGGKKDSLDFKIHQAVRGQAADAGLSYSEDALAY